MRAIRIALLSLAAAAALVPVAPAALAADDGEAAPFAFSVQPATVEPGGTVTLTASECEVPAVAVSSGAFDTVTLAEGSPGKAQIDEGAEPETEYDVTFDCNGEKGHAPLTVAARPGGGGHAPGTSEPDPSDPAAHKPGMSEPGGRDPGGYKPAPHKPDGGVKAGAGGSFSDLGPAQLATGSVLIAGAVGASALLLRRRRPGDSV